MNVLVENSVDPVFLFDDTNLICIFMNVAAIEWKGKCVGNSISQIFQNAETIINEITKLKSLVKPIVKSTMKPIVKPLVFLYESLEIVAEMRLMLMETDGEIGLIVHFLNERLKMLEAVNNLEKTKQYFLANITHELRTPLNGIIGMLELLNDTSLTKQQQEFLEMMRESSYSLMSIINDILDLSKLDAGKMHLNPEQMYLRECIESSIDVVNFRAEEKQLTISYLIEPTVPSYIKADFQRIRQIFVNLLSNAVKFTPRGKIDIHIGVYNPSTDAEIFQSHFDVKDEIQMLAESTPMVWSSEESSSSDNSLSSTEEVKLLIRVSDTGIGIPVEEQTHIFESFHQVSNNNVEEQGGTGLGLPITKRLVEIHGGEIRVISTVGEGSTFVFTLIVQALNTPPENDKCVELLKGRTILIVDDNQTNRIMLCTTLMKWDVHPIACATTDEAIAYVKSEQTIDVALIDIRMPKIDGYKLAEIICNIRPGLPLIAISSINHSIKAKLFRTFLTKPIKERHLLTACCNIYLTPQVRKNSVTPESFDTPILIVEDIYINQKVIVGHLKNIGYSDIDVAADGETAIQMLRTRPYKLLFLDIKLPRLNGIQVFQHIQQECKNIPYTVVVTADVSGKTREHYLTEIGMDDYLSKPVSVAELKRVLLNFRKFNFRNTSGF